MKIERIRKRVLEISEAQSVLRDKVAALSLSSTTDDEIQRIVRQSFAGSIIRPMAPQKFESIYFSSAEDQKLSEDTNKALDTEFSAFLELPTFPFLKNCETQVSMSTSRYDSIKSRHTTVNQNGEGTREESQTEKFTTSSAISKIRSHQVSFKNSIHTTCRPLKSNKTKLGPKGDCRLNQVSSTLGWKKIGQTTPGNSAKNTAESPGKDVEKKAERKCGLDVDKPQYRVLITSVSRKLIQSEPFITPSLSTKVLLTKNMPEKESVPKQIMLKANKIRGRRCFGARLKAARISQDLPNLSSHITPQISAGKDSSPSVSYCQSSTVEELNRIDSNQKENNPFLTISSQFFGGPIGSADCILTLSYPECKKSNLKPTLVDSRSASKQGDTGKKCDCTYSPLEVNGRAPLIESTVKMQHSVHDKKKIENETNVIKCSAQLFQGPIDNADFVVYLLHPTDHHEKSQRQTLINFSEVQVIPIQSAEPCRKNDESFISAGKVEDIMKYQESFETKQNISTEKKSQIRDIVPVNILKQSGEDGSCSLLTWRKSTLSDLSNIDSAPIPNDNVGIKEDILNIGYSRKNIDSEYLPLREIIFPESFDRDIKTQELQTMSSKRFLFPQEGENKMEESKVPHNASSFEILNTSTTFSYELKKTCYKEELYPKMDSLPILLGNDELSLREYQSEEKELRLHESFEPSNIPLSEFQDLSAFFKMQTIHGVPPTRMTCSESTIECSPSSQSTIECSPSSQSQQFSPSNEILLCETVDESYANCTEARYSPTSTYVGTAVGESTVGSELRPIELPPEVFNSRSRRLLRLNGTL